MRTRLMIFAILAPTLVIAQLPERSGDILLYIDSAVVAMPSGTSTNDYQIPMAQHLDAWKTVIQNVLLRQDSLAAVQAQVLNYRLVHFTDTTTGSWPSMQEYLVLERISNASNYWGTYVFAVHPRRSNLIIQSPHPINDSKTGLQSIYVFRSVGARAFFLAGTHRCNSSVFSSCSGTTSTCGASEPFRESDVAHSVNSAFYYATVAAEEIDPPFVIQLHGFAKLSEDPDLIMSNSTNAAPSTDRLAQLRDALLVADPSLTFKIAHLDPAWTRLTGTTNVQGRMINGSSNPCSMASPGNAGRFFHIEQAYSGLRDDATGWAKMASAVATVFTATSAAGSSESLPSGYALRYSYPNPFNPTTTITFDLPERSDVVVDVVNLSGQIVATLADGAFAAGTHTLTWNAKTSSGVYLVRLRAGASGTMVLTQKVILTK